MSKILTIKTMLHRIEMEFSALESPTSPFKSSVYAGDEEGNGLNANIISAIFISRGNGSIKKLVNANNNPIP